MNFWNNLISRHQNSTESKKESVSRKKQNLKKSNVEIKSNSINSNAADSIDHNLNCCCCTNLSSLNKQNMTDSTDLIENTTTPVLTKKMITSARATNSGATTIHIGCNSYTTNAAKILPKLSTSSIPTSKFTVNQPINEAHNILPKQLDILLPNNNNQPIFSVSVPTTSSYQIPTSAPPLTSGGSAQHLTTTDFFPEEKKLHRKVSLMPMVTEEDLKSNSNLGVRDPVSVAQVFGEAFASKFCYHSVVPIPIQIEQPKKKISDGSLHLQIPQNNQITTSLNPHSPLPYDTKDKMLRKKSLEIESTRLSFEKRDSNVPK